VESSRKGLVEDAREQLNANAHKFGQRHGAHKCSSKAFSVESSRKGLVEDARELSMATEFLVAIAAHSASNGSSENKK
jgi:hypothetical protein